MLIQEYSRSGPIGFILIPALCCTFFLSCGKESTTHNAPVVIDSEATLPKIKQEVSNRVLEPTPVQVLPKHTQEWRTYQTITLDHLVDFKQPAIPLSQFGGRTDRREEATGSFYAKKLSDRWILVDPLGYHFWGLGVNAVNPHDDLLDSKEVFKEKFKSKKVWAEQTHSLLQDDLHFNTLGCWSSGGLLFKEFGHPMPYTIHISIMGSFAKKHHLYQPSYGSTNLTGDVLPVFHPDLPAHIDEACQRLVETKDDPWVFGIFSDNEIPLSEEKIIQRYLARGEQDHGTVAARVWLQERGKTENDITPADDREFCVMVLSRYFKLVRETIHKYDPNHMYLGTRFHKTALVQPSAYEAAGKYMDVIAINLYHRWNIDQEQMNAMATLAGKPIMITEWYAKGVDSGLRNVSGAGFLVRSQKDRGRFYENFTISLLRNPNIVGWHWFRYTDEGPLQYQEKASNKGILNAAYQPYPELIESMRRINRNVYGLRDYLLNADSPNFPDAQTLSNQ